MNCLILGGGSKFGAAMVEVLLCMGHHVYVVSSHNLQPAANLSVRQVDWHTVGIEHIASLTRDLPDLDLIVFNQNATALGEQSFRTGRQKQKDWAQAYFVSCQLPFYLVHALKSKISPETRTFWMLSNLVTMQDHLPQHLSSPDYIGNKYTNLCLMQAFDIYCQGCFFGISPSIDIGRGDDGSDRALSERIISYIFNQDTAELKGKILPTSIM